MRLKWTAFFLCAVVAALAVPQASSQWRAGVAHAAVAIEGELIDAGFRARDEHAQDDHHGQDRHDWDDDGGGEFTERDEFHQNYQLAPGAPVRISGINGRVVVETTTGSTAEVHIVRSARTREDLNYRKIIVDQAGGGLNIRTEKDDRRETNRREVRQSARLRLPRNIDFTASGINGRTTVGEIDGPVKVSGVNGRVEVAQARGYTDLSGINGAVTMTITQLNERGIRVSGINGRVELRFAEALNADLSVTGINGSVNVDDLPNVTVQGRVSRTNFNARIGAGGAPITVSGVNGSVRLAPRT